MSAGPPPPPTPAGSAFTYSGFQVVAAWVPTPPHSSALPTYHANTQAWLPFVSPPLPSAQPLLSITVWTITPLESSSPHTFPHWNLTSSLSQAHNILLPPVNPSPRATQNSI